MKNFQRSRKQSRGESITLPKNIFALFVAFTLFCGAIHHGVHAEITHDNSGSAQTQPTADKAPAENKLIEFSDLKNLRKSAAACENGSITLAWSSLSSDSDQEVILEQSDNPRFEKSVVRYRGNDTGSVISGLPEGVHYFRVKYADSSVQSCSSTLKVTVEFFSERKLAWLLGIGGVVVITTIGTIVYGYRKTLKQAKKISATKEVTDAD
ncbi:MAG: hypothetical protein KJO79_01470 [Verrucomicrobiae bacterium]|nr:hypothetical protein [Verrucomicrobiae bacterium]NNJ85817.1 hypothetical protein [Akkermansiaceae bacterium]